MFSLCSIGTLPQPYNAAASIFERPASTSVLSSIRGRSKLSMLYPVIISGSSKRTRLVRPSMMSPSSPRKVCSLRSPPLSMTAAAHRILFDWMLVSRSKEKVTKGVRKGSVLARLSRVHETTMSVG